jgi:hypothetical protein
VSSSYEKSKARLTESVVFYRAMTVANNTGAVTVVTDKHRPCKVPISRGMDRA